MSGNDQSLFFRLIKADQRGARPERAEIDQLKAASHETGNPAGKSRLQAHLRPHLWPLPFSVLAREMRCLICGAPFDGRRAEGPCRRDQQDDAEANSVPAVLDFNPAYFRRRAKRLRALSQATLRRRLRKTFLDLTADDVEVAAELDQRWIRVRHPNRHYRAYKSSPGRRYGAL
jgi:hypothetical protein